MFLLPKPFCKLKEQITVGQITVGQITVGQITVGQITVEQITVGQITVGQIKNWGQEETPRDNDFSAFFVLFTEVVGTALASSFFKVLWDR